MRLHIIGLGMALGVLSIAPLTAAGAPPPKASRLAREGANAFRAGDYTTALERLEEARSIAPEPAQLFVIGRCHEELGHLEAARDAYAAFLEEKVSAEDRGLGETRLAEIERRLTLSRATLVVTRTPESAQVDINGVTTTRAGAVRHELKPGRHTVRIEAPGFEPWSQIVDLEGGTTRELAVVLQASPVRVSEAPAQVVETAVVTPEPPSRALEWTLVGVGGGALVAASILTALSLDAHGEASGDVTMRQAEEATDRGNVLGAGAWTAWGAGVGLVTAGVVLLLVEPDAPAPVLAPVAGGGVFGISGAF